MSFVMHLMALMFSILVCRIVNNINAFSLMTVKTDSANKMMDMLCQNVKFVHHTIKVFIIKKCLQFSLSQVTTL